jgi:hypothetical protein
MIEFADNGGPTDADIGRARDFADKLACKGDILQFGGGKKGEVAELFNELARSIAVMSFTPGGVKLFGAHYDAANITRRGKPAPPTMKIPPPAPAPRRLA